jgi:hypothetical protein
MDDYTLGQLKESRQYHPITTEVIYDWEQIAELSLNAVEISEKGFDSVWDAQFLSFLLKNFKEGFSIGRERMKTKDIKSRFVIEFTPENIDSFDLYDLGEIRHLDGIRGNFGIMDSRCYMVYILLTDNNQPPTQGVFSNFKPLVKKQQKLFEQLWSIGISLPSRIKELEHQSDNFLITNPDEIKNEVNYLVEQSRKELLIFSSMQVLNKVLANSNDTFQVYLPQLLKKDVCVKFLVDYFDKRLINVLDSLNKTIKNNHVQLGNINRLVGNFAEMIILSDNKHMFQIKATKYGQLEATHTEDRHQIFVQEIMFEKFWNEVQSLSGITTTTT